MNSMSHNPRMMSLILWNSSMTRLIEKLSLFFGFLTVKLTHVLEKGLRLIFGANHFLNFFVTKNRGATYTRVFTVHIFLPIPIKIMLVHLCLEEIIINNLLFCIKNISKQSIYSHTQGTYVCTGANRLTFFFGNIYNNPASLTILICDHIIVSNTCGVMVEPIKVSEWWKVTI